MFLSVVSLLCEHSTVPSPEASVFRIYGWEYSGGLSIGAEHRVYFEAAKAVAQSSVQSTGSGLWSCRRSVSGADRVKMWGMNLL